MGAAGFERARRASGVKKPAPAPIRDDGRGWFRTSPEGERCEETSPGAHQGRWARLVSNEPGGERCEETSPGAHQGRWARLVSSEPEGERCEETSPGAHQGRWARLVSSE